MNATDRLHELEGKVVLVCSAQDHRNPPTGLRGTLHVHDENGQAVVQVEMDFPQMFTTRAHHRTVLLNEEQIEEILRSDDYGSYTVTLPDRLDPEAPPSNE